MSDTAPVGIGHGMTAALRLAEEHLAGILGVEVGTPVGVLLTHSCPKRGGEIVQDFIAVKPYIKEVWTLESRDPITMSPSVNYLCCALHGFVREGKWVPA